MIKNRKLETTHLSLLASVLTALCLVVVLSLTLARHSAADEILLKNGNLIQGEIVKVEPKQVSVRVAYEDKETGEINHVDMVFDLATVKSMTRTQTLFRKTERMRGQTPEPPKPTTPATPQNPDGTPGAPGTGTPGGPQAGQPGLPQPGSGAMVPGEAPEIPIAWDYRTDTMPPVLQQWTGTEGQIYELKQYVRHLERELYSLIIEKRKLKNELDDLQGGAFNDPALKDDSAMLELDLMRYYDRDVWSSQKGKELSEKVEDIARRKLLIYKWLERCNAKLTEALAANKAK